MFFGKKPDKIITRQAALAGRANPMPVPDTHFVLGIALKGPFEPTWQTIFFAMGCFWGAERVFWHLDGVRVTAVGYQGGFTPNPTYEEVCSGKTGHTEAVMVVFDPLIISLNKLLKIFWEQHDPTQGMAQGNDVGTQSRSAIYTSCQPQEKPVATSAQLFCAELCKSNKGAITTQIAPATEFYYAESYHQQYLAKNPDGYCGIRGTGVTCPILND